MMYPGECTNSVNCFHFRFSVTLARDYIGQDEVDATRQSVVEGNESSKA